VVVVAGVFAASGLILRTVGLLTGIEEDEDEDEDNDNDDEKKDEFVQGLDLDVDVDDDKVVRHQRR